MNPKWTLIILFLLKLSAGFGQEENSNPISLAIKPQYGFILPHSSKVGHLTHTNPFGMEFEYAWLMIKEKNWQQCNCYSKAGISFLYINYGNPDVVGSSYNLIGFAEPYFIRKQNFLLSARMGVGVSYLDKIYDSKTNPDNTFFSTSVSFLVHIDLNAYFKISNQLKIITFAKYNHISNGGIKEPNYGVNFPTFGVGLEYMPQENMIFPNRLRREFNSDLFYNAYVFGWTKKIGAENNYPEKTSYVLGIYGLVGKTISVINGFSIGLEYLNDGGAKEEIKRLDLDNDHQQISGLIGHHLLFGKFDFSQYWGTYVYSPYKSANFYQRYSLTYELANHFLVGVTLKAHADIADSFQVLLGWSF